MRLLLAILQMIGEALGNIVVAELLNRVWYLIVIRSVTGMRGVRRHIHLRQRRRLLHKLSTEARRNL